MFPLSFHELAESFRFADALDLFVGTALFLAMFQWIRHRSAHALLVAALAVIALYLLSDWLRMYLTLAIFQTGLTLMFFALIVIFQNDLRNAFERLTAWTPFRKNPMNEPRAEFLETLVEAMHTLAEEKVGALVVLPARQSLQRHLRGGIALDGQISIPLLHSIFHPESQGHDGAAIVRGRRIDRFGVHLPLSKNIAELGPGGTRHAAALGLSERSDALIIVVSEERGQISVARYGQLQPLGSAAELSERLDNFYRGAPKPRSLWTRLKKVAESGLIVLVSLFASVVLWLSFAHQVDHVQRVVDQVPIQSGQVPENWIVESVEPQTVRVNISGSKRAFDAFNWNDLAAHLDLSKVQEGAQTLVIGEEVFDLPREMSIIKIEPKVIRVVAHEIRYVVVPVEVRTQGKVAEGFTLASATASPSQVLVSVSTSRSTELKSVETEPIDVAGLDSSQTRQVNLILPENVWPAPESQTSVTVQLEITEDEPPE